MHSEILRPMAALVAWTLAMLAWAVATRMAALRKAGIDMGKLVGTTAASADRVLPPQVQWKAHNYNHLNEQPTLFYAVCTVIALSGTGDGANAAIAWVYVGLRVLHSLVQTTVNRVRPRFLLFAASSIALAALALHALMAVF